MDELHACGLSLLNKLFEAFMRRGSLQKEMSAMQNPRENEILGFAIPSKRVTFIAPQLIETGRVTDE